MTKPTKDDREAAMKVCCIGSVCASQPDHAEAIAKAMQPERERAERERDGLKWILGEAMHAAHCERETIYLREPHQWKTAWAADGKNRGDWNDYAVLALKHFRRLQKEQEALIAAEALDKEQA